MKILFIDDEELTLKIGRLMLESWGHNVSTANNGADGLKLLKQQSFDLILLDLMMPGIYGLDVLRQIKANKSWLDIPVILQTGVSNSSDIEQGRKLGATIMTKPYDSDTLKTYVEHLCKNLLEVAN